MILFSGHIVMLRLTSEHKNSLLPVFMHTVPNAHYIQVGGKYLSNLNTLSQKYYDRIHSFFFGFNRSSSGFSWGCFWGDTSSMYCFVWT